MKVMTANRGGESWRRANILKNKSSFSSIVIGSYRTASAQRWRQHRWRSIWQASKQPAAKKIGIWLWAKKEGEESPSSNQTPK